MLPVQGRLIFISLVLTMPSGIVFDEHKMQKQIFDMLLNNALSKLLKYFDGMDKLIIIKFYIRSATKYE